MTQETAFHPINSCVYVFSFHSLEEKDVFILIEHPDDSGRYVIHRKHPVQPNGCNALEWAGNTWVCVSKDAKVMKLKMEWK